MDEEQEKFEKEKQKKMSAGFAIIEIIGFVIVGITDVSIAIGLFLIGLSWMWSFKKIKNARG